MGIVAYCPNGHRMKVKDELAGRKGICPTCSARFRIPRQSADQPPGGQADGLDRPPPARVVSLDPAVASSLPAAFALDDADTVDAGQPAVDPADVLPDFAPLDAAVTAPDSLANPAERPAVEEPAAGVPPAHAMLDERPDLPWCVAVRGGTPSAPLAAADMRAWLDSGAATSDHVVWRADWPDWRALGEVFPHALPPEPRGWP